MFKQIHKIPGKFVYSFQCSVGSFFAALYVVLSPFACDVTLCCLSITVLRVHWGKPLSPHLHFSWELWHSGEIKRYQMASTPRSGFTNLDLFQPLELCNAHILSCQKYFKCFHLISFHVCSVSVQCYFKALMNCRFYTDLLVKNTDDIFSLRRYFNISD